MFTTGLAISIGRLLVFVKRPRQTLLRVLHHDLTIDLVVSALVLVVHFGTFSGAMVAAIAGPITSVATSIAKRLVGYVKGGKTTPITSG